MQLKRKRRYKKFFLLCVMAIAMKAKAQNANTYKTQTPNTQTYLEPENSKTENNNEDTTSYHTQQVSKWDIDILYSHYTQDGNNSAITGGVGTEKLIVYAPSVRVGYTLFNDNVFSLDGGVDVITSASKDNIDYVMSSASALDYRYHGALSYSREIPSLGLTLGVGTGFSAESMYISIPIDVNMSYTSPDKVHSFSAKISTFFDDLRWGRRLFKPWSDLTLIYPYELRWFMLGKASPSEVQYYDTFLRNSYSLVLSYSYAINKRMVLGIFPQLSYQTGILATPYQRVFFKSGSTPANDKQAMIEDADDYGPAGVRGPEQLPYERLRAMLGVGLNAFVGERVILKPLLSMYWDTFDVLSGSLELECAIKVSNGWTLSPVARVSMQRQSMYFKPYMMHTTDEKYYTSDYDLSSFQLYKFGLGVKYAPFAYMVDKFLFKEVEVRYSFYYRSNNLQAHTLTFAFSFSSE